MAGKASSASTKAVRGRAGRSLLPGARLATGPKTAAGKQRSSQNALVHGATSPKLLDEQEREAYLQLLEALRKQYPSSHPLVQMQLERISRLKVQLDRVQNVIDASFVAARLDGEEPDARTKRQPATGDSIDLLDWQLARTIDKYMDGMGGWLDSHEGALVRLCAELSVLDDFERLNMHDDFLRYVPAFCTYIIEHARTNQQSTSAAIADVCRSPYAIPSAVMDPLVSTLSAALKRPTIDTTEARHERYSGPPQNVSDVSAAELRACAERLREQAAAFLQRLDRLRELNSRKELTQEAAMPDPEKLDRLMRYQTTINRQLSSAMGELLELVRLG